MVMAGTTSLYAAFDIFPSAKGAATHIYHASRTLFDYFGSGLLSVLGDEAMPRFQQEGSVFITRYQSSNSNYLERAMGFSAWLQAQLVGCAPSLRVAQFRDPWSGLALVNSQSGAKLIYEVNGLPSVELRSLYPALNNGVLDKIRDIEAYCCDGAQVIVVPSSQIRSLLISRGVSTEKVRVVPNGADLVVAEQDRSLVAQIPQQEGSPRSIIYFGALQSWQGLDVLLRAMAMLEDICDLRLVVLVSTTAKQARPYRKLAAKLGLGDRVVWKYRLSKSSLGFWLSNATLSVAPLVSCERNLVQGCCPLKILESMAYGVPVVASNLPAVREILEHGHDGYLVAPDRPADLSRALRLLLDYPDYREELGRNARIKVEGRYLWKHNKLRMESIYDELQ